MKINKLILGIFAAAVLSVSCSSDDDSNAPLGSYDDGILVLNEGGLGTVTYISDDLQTVQQDIFGAVNGSGPDIGSYVQSMFFAGDRAFIISNGSNRITVVNRYTFEKLGEISTGLATPRYGVAHNGKAYVTNSNTFESATDDYIAVIDLNTLAVTTTIPVNNQAEKLIEENGKLYVSGGFYGVGNDIIVIDTASNQIVTTIDLGDSPNSLEEEDGILYALCSTWGGPSKIVKIQLSDNSVMGEIPCADTMLHAENLDIEDGMIYFTVGPNIYRSSLNAAQIADTPFIATGSNSDYIGYGFAVEDGKVFISEAADDFSSDGKAYIYSQSNGSLLKTITVGLGPNGFYFN